MTACLTPAAIEHVIVWSLIGASAFWVFRLLLPLIGGSDEVLRAAAIMALTALAIALVVIAFWIGSCFRTA